MKKISFFVMTVIVVTILIYMGPLINWLSKPLIVKDKIENTNAIVILSGGLNIDGSLGSSTKERIDYGLKLFQAGYAPKIILSGGGFDQKIKDAQVMYDYALEKGFPPDVFIIEPYSSSTYENILLTRRILEEKGYKSIILVTSPYHSYRAKKMFIDKNIKVISMPVEKSELYNAKGKEKLRMLKLVAMEYVKTEIYQLTQK